MAEQPQSQRDAERSHEARQALDRVQRESGLLGSSELARAARHFGGADAPAGDRIEVWGRRIGRTLGLIFVLYLITWLVDWFSR
jgi:hypothetical protein